MASATDPGKEDTKMWVGLLQESLDEVLNALRYASVPELTPEEAERVDKLTKAWLRAFVSCS
jgi:hypothetical protein